MHRFMYIACPIRKDRLDPHLNMENNLDRSLFIETIIYCVAKIWNDKERGRLRTAYYRLRLW